MDWNTEALMALRTIIAAIIFSLLALYHFPAWHKVKSKARAHHRHEEKHP